MKRQTARLGLPFEAMMPEFKRMVEEVGFSVSDTADGVSVSLPEGRVMFSAADTASQITIEAENDAFLSGLREIVTFQVNAQNLPAALEWAADQEGGRPANFLIARIAASDRISPSFQRVRITGDFARFGEDSLHFRLIFGPEGADWPSSDATGATVWPGGIERWHRPPYTIRAIDPHLEWIDVDIFLHEGGRVTDWLAEVRPGDEVALTGPGGKSPQVANWIAYIGDETALPVIARMVARLPDQTQGLVRIFVSAAADIQPIPHPQGVDLEWLVRGEGSTPLSVVSALCPPDKDRYVFFAGERQQAASAREILTKMGIGRGECHCAAYWTEGWVPPETQALARRRSGAPVP